ncbi:hypothetical protein PVAP13_8NG256902 [Panicum virgatum]|uniref:Uncharacterized protein n=1 Tax=Panicum virgatum TaxID=38727 RepID=A0A8T0P5W4_PANVG|nr:hypothetical protein PVAP13_8NG256902 [Panicum virgatum]
MGIVLVVAPVQAAASCRPHYHPSARPRRRSQHRSLRRRSLCRPPCRCSLRGPRRCSSPARWLLRSVALAGITPMPRVARRKTKPRSFRAACSHSAATPCEAARRRRSSQGHAAAPRVGRPAPPSAARLLALASVSAPPPRPPSPLARAPRIHRDFFTDRRDRTAGHRFRTRPSRPNASPSRPRRRAITAQELLCLTEHPNSSASHSAACLSPRRPLRAPPPAPTPRARYPDRSCARSPLSSSHARRRRLLLACACPLHPWADLARPPRGRPPHGRGAGQGKLQAARQIWAAHGWRGHPTRSITSTPPRGSHLFDGPPLPPHQHRPRDPSLHQLRLQAPRRATFPTRIRWGQWARRQFHLSTGANARTMHKGPSDHLVLNICSESEFERVIAAQDSDDKGC